MPYTKPLGEADVSHGRRFALIAAGVCALVSFLPYLYGLLVAPVGQTYIGYQYNTDDHMVYSAWMRQAMDGHFFFDNRFAIDAQPGLTVHIYFFILGLLAKLTGLSLAANLAKAFFSGLFVLVLYRLLLKVSLNNFFIKLALSVAVVGGGVGFLVWHRFGEAIVTGVFAPYNEGFKGLPIDVWQPEAFVFPSMLTNGLFMVSLCLIVGFFWCVLEARESWRVVPFGFLWMAVLMNIHSYDVLIVSLVLAGFLMASLASRTASAGWIARVVVMSLGAVGPALWFYRVFQDDPVFRARAAVETLSPNFRQVFFGLFVVVALGLVAVLRGIPEEPVKAGARRLGAAALAVGLLVLLALAGSAGPGYWMGMAGWSASLAAALILVAVLASNNSGWNLTISWALVGLAAIYFPAAFQRKLSMGIEVPWAILAAIGLWQVAGKLERGTRNLVGALAILVLSASSVRWFLREGEFIRGDVSRTTVHSVFLTDDATRILRYLNEQPGRKVVLAMPGIAEALVSDDQVVLDSFKSPYLPDLNAIAAGMTGSYAYSGHWGETPDYLRRRTETTKFFLTDWSDADRRELIQRIGVTHIIAPVPETYNDFYERTQKQLADVTGLGTVVVDGSQFRLVELSP